MTEKEQALRAMQELPETATFEDAMERLLVLYKIQRGIELVEQGKVVSHEEAKRRLSKWLE